VIGIAGNGSIFASIRRFYFSNMLFADDDKPQKGKLLVPRQTVPFWDYHLQKPYKKN